MGNHALTVCRYDWLGEGRQKVEAEWATFVQQHLVKMDRAPGSAEQSSGVCRDISHDGIELSELVALWLEQYELNLILGKRVRTAQHKRRFSSLMVVEYASEQHIVSGDLFCDVKVVLDPRSLKMHECTMLRKHN